jgi:hypothetical protein
MDDPRERWLEEAFGGQETFLTQFQIHGASRSKDPAVDKVEAKYDVRLLRLSRLRTP